jgi:hypothetical protein
VIRVAAWLCAFAALGCRGDLRFDEHRGDAAASGASDAATGTGREAPAPSIDGARADPPACGDIACGLGFAVGDCTAMVCHLECHGRQLCTGGCGNGCAGECEDGSQCTLAAGDGANLHCEEGARCTFAVGDGSEVRCESGASCEVRCLGSCALTCGQAATCMLACGPEAAPGAITLSGSCP